MWTNLIYFVGSILYIPASILLFWPYDSVAALCSTIIYILGGCLFFTGGIIDICSSHKVNAISILYLIGGFAFAVGAFLFLSSDSSRVGIWTFRCGSLCYISGSAILIVTMPIPRSKLKLLATLQYMCGSSLFVIGGILSEAKAPFVSFAIIWVIGSIGFTGGACVNLFCHNHILQNSFIPIKNERVAEKTTTSSHNT